LKDIQEVWHALTADRTIPDCDYLTPAATDDGTLALRTDPDFNRRPGSVFDLALTAADVRYRRVAVSHLLAWRIAKPSLSEGKSGFWAITEALLNSGSYLFATHERKFSMIK
jgi:hypothetical protein